MPHQRAEQRIRGVPGGEPGLPRDVHFLRRRRRVHAPARGPRRHHVIMSVPYQPRIHSSKNCVLCQSVSLFAVLATITPSGSPTPSASQTLLVHGAVHRVQARIAYPLYSKRRTMVIVMSGSVLLIGVVFSALSYHECDGILYSLFIHMTSNDCAHLVSAAQLSSPSNITGFACSYDGSFCVKSWSLHYIIDCNNARVYSWGP